MYIKYNKAKNYILCEMIIDKQIVNNICVYIAIYTKCVPICEKKVKLQRAYGECLGIRSR